MPVPRTIERSDRHARAIWTKTHDSAVTTYGEGRRTHMVAFASLKQSYEKKDDRWVRKARKGPSDPQAARGPTTRRRVNRRAARADRPRQGRAHAAEAKVKADEARGEYARARRRHAK